MKRFLCGLGVFSVLGLMAAGCAPTTGGGDEDATDEAAVLDVAPTGKHITVRDVSGSPSGQSKAVGDSVVQAGINYHNGPVMTAPIKLYYIWYGNWAGNSATSILTDLAGSIGGSPYWNINSSYTNAAGTPVSTNVTFGGSINDTAYSKGKSLSDNAIKSIVSSAITTGKLPKDANGIYFVLTSADVNATSGFCTQYCGWHTHASIGGADIKYSFVGNPDRCPTSCEDQQVGPNGNAGADGMASIIAHEAEEAASDPDLNAWYDAQGYENADKCAWTFGTTYTVNGALANVHLGSRDYLIQQNWLNVAPGGKCAMSY